MKCDNCYCEGSHNLIIYKLHPISPPMQPPSANASLLPFLQRIHDDPRHDDSLLQSIYDLYIDNDANLQLLDLYACSSLLRALRNRQASLTDISEHLRHVLTQPIVEKKVETFQEAESVLERNEYKIKKKSRIVDAFASRDIVSAFEKYSHLYRALKQLARKARSTIPALNQLARSIHQHEKLAVGEATVKGRVEEGNEWVCINEIIQEVLPEAQHPDFLRDLEREFSTSYRKSLQELTAAMAKRWEEAVTQALQRRRQQKRPVLCEIANWMTVDLIFPSKTRLVLCLEQIQQWCGSYAAIIVGVEGDLERELELRLKVLVSEVCCTISLKVNYGLRRKRFLKAVQTITSSRTVVFNTLLNANRSHSLLKDLQTTAASLSHTHHHDRQQLAALKEFIKDMEPVVNWDRICKFEKQKMSESCLNPVKIGKPISKRIQTEQDEHFPTAHQITQSLEQEDIPSGHASLSKSVWRQGSFSGDEADSPSKCRGSLLLETHPDHQDGSNHSLEGLAYKRIHSEHDSEHEFEHELDEAPSLQQGAEQSLLRLEAENEELRRSIEDMRREHEEARNRYSEQALRTQEEISSLKSKLELTRLNNANLTARIAQSDSRARQALQTADLVTASITQALDQARIQQAKAQQLEAKLLTLQTENADLSAKIRQLEAQCQKLKEEGLKRSQGFFEVLNSQKEEISLLRNQLDSATQREKDTEVLLQELRNQALEATSQLKVKEEASQQLFEWKEQLTQEVKSLRGKQGAQCSCKQEAASARRRLEYMKILFFILFLEATTVSFLSRLFL